MFVKIWNQFSETLEDLLNNPLKVFWICLGVAFLSLVASGTLLQLWGLHRNIEKIKLETQATSVKLIDIRQDLLQAQDPGFIEKQARERFDLVHEGDLVFVFSDEPEASKKK